MRFEPVAPNEPLGPGRYYIHVRATNAVVELVRRWPTLAQKVANHMQRQFAGRVQMYSRGLEWIGNPRTLVWVIEARVLDPERAGQSGNAAPMVAAGVVITAVAIAAALAFVLGITLTVRSIVRVRVDACDEHPELCRSREGSYRLVAWGLALAAAAALLHAWGR